MKPIYKANPLRDRAFPVHGKTPEPADAQLVYRQAIEGPPVEGKPPNWYGLGFNREIYRFSPANDGTAHFSGMTGGPEGLRFEDIPMQVRKALGRIR
jgi:hypothetical protein